MSSYWNFEFKETCSGWDEWETITEGDGNTKLVPKYHPPGYKWIGETDYFIGICYKSEMPRPNMTTDEVYQLAIDAKYYLYDNKAFEEIGEAGSPLDFLKWLAGLREEPFAISWPNEFDNYFRFNRADIYQVLPWRELIRRHFDQRAIAQDVDMKIHRTRLRRG